MKVELTKMVDHLYVGTIHGGKPVYEKNDIKGILKEAELSWNKMINYKSVSVNLPKKTLEKYHAYSKSYKGMPYHKKDFKR